MVKKSAQKPQAFKARHGEKMIEIKLRFWTNNIARARDKILKKHAWSAGVVRIEPNQAHGIKPGKPLPFHTLLDVGAAIEKVLIGQGITLHPGRKMRKYISNK